MTTQPPSQSSLQAAPFVADFTPRIGDTLVFGLDVPRDISVCGFDDTAMATTIWPELTTIRQPISGMAREAVTLLAQALDQSAGGSIQHRLVAFELIQRGSTGAPAD
jgi:DNA-binding LacI/PurR family transcriptional regulator